MKKKISICILVGMFILQSTIFAEEKVDTKLELSDEYNVFEQVAGYISTYYIDDTLSDDDIMRLGISELIKNDDELLVKLLKSMIGGLDPYSEFFTKEEYQGFVNNLNRTFYGIGVRIEYKDEYVEVTGFTSGSPSEEAGLMIGDKISKVNGEDVKGLGLEPVREKILGELGTTVNVTVLRNGSEYIYTVTRAEVNDSTVALRILNDKIAYVSIIDMSNHTSEEFANILKTLDEEKITNIILDLRNNVGGYLDAAVNLSRQVVPKGKIVDTIYRQSFMNKTYDSDLENAKYKFKILVNENTASAAEIFASALQDSGVGTLIGDTTYGKGVIQSTFPLSNGSVFKITVGHYVTRNGREINGIGLKPDTQVINPTNPIDTSTYTPFTYKNKWYVGNEDSNVKAAKERLYFLRYYNGMIDNSFDVDLESAIKSFQFNNNLYPYGVLDITTQTKLENEFAKIEIETDKQLEEAFVEFGGTAKELDEILSK